MRWSEGHAEHGAAAAAVVDVHATAVRDDDLQHAHVLRPVVVALVDRDEARRRSAVLAAIDENAIRKAAQGDWPKLMGLLLDGRPVKAGDAILVYAAAGGVGMLAGWLLLAIIAISSANQPG